MHRQRDLLAALSIVLVFAAAAAFAALSFPPLAGRVTDAANVLSPDSRAALERKLVDLENQSSIQLVVATVPSLQDTDIETYANGLFRAWKLGEAKRNNGALLVVAPNERKVRIEVGYGLEGTITDALSSVIIQSAIIPRFKAGDFSGGVDRGVDALISAMTDDQSEWHKKVRVRRGEGQGDDTLAFWLFIAILLFIFWLSVRNVRTRGRGPIFIPSGSWGGGSWSGGSGGFSGGGSFGDGGFSGGGGSSGGGGASGSW